MTYAEALTHTNTLIRGSLVNSSDPLELVCFVLGISREQFYSASPTIPLTQEQEAQLLQVINDYNASKPLAYILKKAEFLGNELIIKPGVLIPRPETELLVETFLNELFQNNQTKPVNILEIGTGSGCIISTVAKSLRGQNMNFNIEGIDPSPTAFELTCRNIEQILGTKLTQSQSSASYQDARIRIKITNISIQEYHGNFKPDYIISNPPYITSAEMAELDTSVRDFEPELALHGGTDGLEIYRQIATYAKGKIPKPKLYLEISPIIAVAVSKLFQETGYTTQVKNDQFGRERFLFCQ